MPLNTVIPIDLRARPTRRPRRAFGPVTLLLHVTDLGLELLVAELKLLDDAGELSNLGLQPLDPQQNVGPAGLRRALRGRLYGAALAARALAAAENEIEQPARPLAFLRPTGCARRGCSDHERKRECVSTR